MAARVLHFGWDDCYRIQVLRQAGYTVAEADSLEMLDLDLQRDPPVDAVILSDDDGNSMELAARVVRRRSAAPIILFRRSQRPLDERNFDLVFLSFVPPQIWLAETAALIARSREVRSHSALLVAQSRAACEQAQPPLERSPREHPLDV